MSTHRQAKLAVQEALAAALSRQGHTGHQPDRNGQVQCNCESLVCDVCRGKGCKNRVPMNVNLIEFIGETCPGCYATYPEEYHRGAYERGVLADALRQYGGLGSARTRRRKRRQQGQGEVGVRARRRAQRRFAEGVWAQDYHRYLRGETED